MARILWFHPRQLLPPRGGGDHRTLGLVHGALGAGHQVLLVQCDEAVVGAEIPEGLEVAELRTRTGVTGGVSKIVSRDPLRSPRPTRASMAAVRRNIEAFDPEVGVVSEVMTWGLTRRLMPDIEWIYDSQNVEHELFADHLSSASTAVDKLTFRVDRRRVAHAERNLLARSAATLVVSDADGEDLRLLSPQANLVLAPSSMPTPPVTVDPASAGQVALFVGTLDFPPNIEALHLLVEQVIPRVRETVPGVRLRVVGRRPTARVRELLRSPDWVEFWEDAPVIDAAYSGARCVVMPFEWGSGTKLKVYEALAFGMPVVTTSRGVRGVDVRPGLEVLLAEDVEALAAATADLMNDPQAAARLGTAARAAFTDRLSWERATYPQLSALIQRLSPEPVG